MGGFLALAWIEIKLFLRDPFATIFALIFPLIMMLLLAAVFGDSPPGDEVDGRLVFRGISVTTGPWREPRFHGAPYDERGGSVTTVLGTDAAILSAGRELAVGGY